MMTQYFLQLLSKNSAGEQLKDFKEEKDKIFFSEHDNISLSIEYFDTSAKQRLASMPRKSDKDW